MATHHGLDCPELDQVDGALLLPCDFSRNSKTTRVLERHSFELPIPMIGGDPEHLVIALFAISLYRYSGQSSIPLDVAIGGKTRSLQLTTASATCGDLADQIAEQLRTSVRAAGEGSAAISWGTDTASSTADLHLIMTGSGEATFVYNTELFKRTTVQRLAGHLEELVGSVANQLDAPIAELPLIPTAEREWLDAFAYGRPRSLPPELVHQQIEQHAIRTPDAIATRYRDDQLTYAQLNRRANQLAHYLASAGIGAEGRIVVCVEPSFDIQVALLGILKAGAVYVPIDPSYPATRIRAILDDTRPALVISRSALIERLGLGEFPTLALDTAELEPWPAENLDATIDWWRTAYIYYTSGTTGKPKGVMASQQNLVTYVEVARERYAMTSDDVMPAIARFSFSISMFELAAPLVAGGTSLILDRDHVLDPARMAVTLSEVTFFHAGPSLLKHVLPHIERTYQDRSRFAGVRHASSGGDMIPPEILESLKRIFTNAEVFVIYGCSEISCMGCTYPVPRDKVVTRTYVGRPFDNVIVRVLDAAFNPVPIGVIGEIHFAGGGVVKGYLNRPELTAEKFIEHGGERFYRTGDMGRMSDDGWLEILGRNDFQIKVRGMRIELGEVEFNLRRAPGVRDAVVMAKVAPGGDKIMVGYVVRGDTAADRNTWMLAIRRHMVDSVPDYMVPTMFMELASLPLNHNMKVDRHALPDPEYHRTVAQVREPETPTEQRLASLWKDVIGVSQVGLDDNFFELGADSLLATELIVRADTESNMVIEGIDLLRESLEVIAAICDRRKGATWRKPPRPHTVSSAAVEVFHFGPNATLYGVLHGGRGASAIDEAVVICAPIGQEQARARFVLGKLARVLAARGTPVLLFDHYGLGDSSGDSIDATLGRWQDDIVEAHHELVRRTGATRVAAVGVRLGAALLGSVVDKLELSKVVLWDPVYRGAELLAEQSALHRRYLRGMRHIRKGATERIPGAEELLGISYSDVMLHDLQHLAIMRIDEVSMGCLATYDIAGQLANFSAITGGRAGCQTAALTIECGWRDIARLEEMIPDLGIVAKLTQLLGAA